MARAGTRSSQRQPTQTQAGNAAPGPSQQRRPRNTQAHNEPEGEDDGSSNEEQDEMDVDQEENTEGTAVRRVVYTTLDAKQSSIITHLSGVREEGLCPGSPRDFLRAKKDTT